MNDKRPEPVMNSAQLAGLLIALVKAALVMLTSLGLVSWDTNQQAAINAFVVAVIDVGIVLATMYFGARGKVTAVNDPAIQDEGTGKLVPLVRADGGPLPE